jgi:hypothetical protein
VTRESESAMLRHTPDFLPWEIRLTDPKITVRALPSAIYWTMVLVDT